MINKTTCLEGNKENCGCYDCIRNSVVDGFNRCRNGDCDENPSKQMNHKTFLNASQFVYTATIRYVHEEIGLYVGLSDDDDFIYFIEHDIAPDNIYYVIDENNDHLRDECLDYLEKLETCIEFDQSHAKLCYPPETYDIFTQSSKYALRLLDSYIQRFDNYF